MSDEPTRPDPPGFSETTPGAPHQPSSDAPQVEGFKIIEKIGEGGMGTVWRAIQLSTKREVALKLISAAFLGSEKIRSRFEREVELAARLEHPNVARVYESGRCQNVDYFAMEFIDGVHLDEYVKQHRLSQRKILELTRTVCEAIQYAHQRMVIHTDLKPPNILVTKDGQPHILDFGLAKPLREGDPGLSATGQVAGTLYFMSPEQAAGRREWLDTRTDVYSIGVILFRLLTEQYTHNFTGDFERDRQRIVNEEVKRPRWISRDIDEEIELLLLTALAKERERRYASPGELASELRRYLNDEPIRARPPSKWYQVRKFAKRNKVLVGGLAAVVISLAAGIVGTSVGLVKARSEAARAEEQTKQVVEQKNRAQTAEKQSRKENYATLVLLAEQAIQQKSFRLADQLLAQAPSELRGWEWGRLKLLCHTEAFSLTPGRPILALGAYRDNAAQFVAGMSLWDTDLKQAAVKLQKSRIGARCVGLSPDFQHAVIGSEDGRLGVWDAATGRFQFSLTGHTNSVNTAIFSPDGKRLVTGSADGSLRLWDIDNGQQLKVFVGHDRPVSAVAWCRPKQKLDSGDAIQTCVASGDDGGRIILWDASTGHAIRQLGTGETSDPPVLQAIDELFPFASAPLNRVAPPKAQGKPRGRGSDKHSIVCKPIQGLAFMPGEQHLLCASPGQFQVWDLLSNSVVRSQEGGSVLSINKEGGQMIEEMQRHPGFMMLNVGGVITFNYRDGNKPGVRLWFVEGGYVRDQMTDTRVGEMTCNYPGDSDPRSRRTSKPVACLAFSHDGGLLVSGHTDGAICLWNTKSGILKREFGASHPGVKHICFDPRDRVILSASDDGTLSIWDVGSSKKLTSFAAGPGSIASIAFGPDGERIITGDQDGNGHVWHIESGQAIANLARPDLLIEAAAFAGHKPILATGYADGAVTLWDTANEKELISFSTGIRGFAELAISADGGTLIAINNAGNAQCWDGVTGRQLSANLASNFPVTVASVTSNAGFFALGGTNEQIRLIRATTAQDGTESVSVANAAQTTALTLEPTGKYLLAGDALGNVSVWNVDPLKLLWRSKQHQSEVRSVEFDPTATRIVSSSQDQTAIIWDLSSREPLMILKGHDYPLKTACFTTNGNRVVTADVLGNVKIWDTQVSKEQLVLSKATFAISSTRGRLLALADDSGLFLIDMVTGRLVHALHGKGGSLTNVDFSADDKLILGAGSNGTVDIWDAASGDLLNSIVVAQSELTCTAFSVDGRRIAAGSREGVVTLCDWREGTKLLTLQKGAAAITCVRFSKSGKRLITACADGTLVWWDAVSGQVIRSMQRPLKGDSRFALSPDGTAALATTGYGEAELWNTENDKGKRILKGHQRKINETVFSADGIKVGTASADGTARIWNRVTGENQLILEGHKGEVKTIAFSPDGLRVLTGGADGTARVWSGESGRALLTLDNQQDPITEVAWTANGQSIIVRGAKRTVVWSATEWRENR